MDRLAMEAVALVVVRLRDGGVDGDLVEVRAPEAEQLRVEVRVDSPGEQGVVREVDPGHQVLDAERDLLGLGQEVVGVAVEHHASDRRHGHQLLRHDLGRVEHVEAGPRVAPAAPPQPLIVTESHAVQQRLVSLGLAAEPSPRPVTAVEPSRKSILAECVAPALAPRLAPGARVVRPSDRPSCRPCGARPAR
jgi:hypothetical protein